MTHRDVEQLLPEAYGRWFDTELGRRVWDDERRALGRLLGSVHGRRVLDAGAGDGRLAVDLDAEGARVVGTDRSPSMLRAGRARTEESHAEVRWVAGDLRTLPFRTGAFDVVVTVTVLCFMSDPLSATRELARVTRAGGRVVIGELGRWSPWALRRRLEGWLGDGLWADARFWTPRELQELLRAAGLRPDRVRGAVFYPRSAVAARLLRPLERWLEHRTTLGAAFLAVTGTKEDGHA